MNGQKRTTAAQQIPEEMDRHEHQAGILFSQRIAILVISTFRVGSELAEQVNVFMSILFTDNNEGLNY